VPIPKGFDPDGVQPLGWPTQKTGLPGFASPSEDVLGAQAVFDGGSAMHAEIGEAPPLHVAYVCSCSMHDAGEIRTVPEVGQEMEVAPLKHAR
jgi:hypothetical protein